MGLDGNLRELEVSQAGSGVVLQFFLHFLIILPMCNFQCFRLVEFEVIAWDVFQSGQENWSISKKLTCP